MVLDRKETTVAYRCPDCGCFVKSVVGVFSLSADMLKLKCSCGKSEMSIVYGKDKKIRFIVPCFVCPKPHSFNISSQMFFAKELFAFPCAYSGLDICYFGKEDKVSEACDNADRELTEILAEMGCESLPDFKNGQNGDEIFSDPQILEIINFVIRDLDECGEITCKCEKDEGLYDVEVTDDGVKVSCERCGASLSIPVTSTMSAQAFLNCDHLDLK